MLVGPSENSALPTLYVGQADRINQRLKQHNADDTKDFWTHAICFTSKDDNLNKAHILHLESRLVRLAKDAKRSKLANGNQPSIPSLSEVDEATADAFLDDMLLCLPVLGCNYFESGAEVVARETQAGDVELFFLRGKGIEAQGKQVPSGFAVLKGSTGVGDEKVVASFAPHVPAMKAVRDLLIEQGILAPNGDHFVLTEDYIFSSPSTAAGVLFGRSANGRVDWKTEDGRTLKEVQEAEAGL
jgi:predicted GIY-YIG superfamily endonuclease